MRIWLILITGFKRTKAKIRPPQSFTTPQTVYFISIFDDFAEI